MNKQNIKSNDTSRYDEPKIMFFMVLSISAMLDIPTFVGCLAVGSPRDCEWNGESYQAFWCFHLIALCGYAFVIVTPPILWSDIINQRDGKLWFSSHPADNTKRFFQFMLLLYFATQVMTLVEVILSFKSASSFQDENFYYTVAVVMEACIIVSICIGCLTCGVRLQWYVRTVKLCTAMEMTFLFRLNVTLVIVLAAYLTRSFYIIRLLPDKPQDIGDALHVSYFAWTLCTRWLPFVLCPFCLMHEMRFSGAEIAARNTLLMTASAKSNSTMEGGSPMHTASANESDADRESFLSTGMSGQTSHLIYMSKGGGGGSRDGETPSSLSLALLSDELSPSNRYFEDSFRIHSSDSLHHIDHFGPPSFNETTQSALHRTLSTPSGV